MPVRREGGGSRRQNARPIIRVRPGGRIHFSPAALKILGAGEDAAVEFLRDRKRTSDWFVRLSPGGLPLQRNLRKKTAGRACQNKFLASAILEACGEADGLEFLLAAVPVESGSDIYALLWRKGEGMSRKGGKRREP